MNLKNRTIDHKKIREIIKNYYSYQLSCKGKNNRAMRGRVAYEACLQTLKGVFGKGIEEIRLEVEAEVENQAKLNG